MIVSEMFSLREVSAIMRLFARMNGHYQLH